ncbi:MAG: hypothetical protein ACK4IT_04730 [Thioalkalivibrionaceae bacterium]
MSEPATLNLSEDLIARVQATLVEQDSNAAHPIVAVQYLAAVQGFMLAQIDEPIEARKDYLEQLAAFTHSVFIDMESRRQARSQQAGQPGNAPAMGVWRPGDA